MDRKSFYYSYAASVILSLSSCDNASSSSNSSYTSPAQHTTQSPSLTHTAEQAYRKGINNPDLEHLWGEITSWQQSPWYMNRDISNTLRETATYLRQLETTLKSSIEQTQNDLLQHNYGGAQQKVKALLPYLTTTQPETKDLGTITRELENQARRISSHEGEDTILGSLHAYLLNNESGKDTSTLTQEQARQARQKSAEATWEKILAWRDTPEYFAPAEGSAVLQRATNYLESVQTSIQEKLKDTLSYIEKEHRAEAQVYLEDAWKMVNLTRVAYDIEQEGIRSDLRSGDKHDRGTRNFTPHGVYIWSFQSFLTDDEQKREERLAEYERRQKQLRGENVEYRPMKPLTPEQLEAATKKGIEEGKRKIAEQKKKEKNGL